MGTTQPLENVRQFRTEESEMSYLTAEQIESLLKECRNSSAEDLEIIVKICPQLERDGVKQKA